MVFEIYFGNKLASCLHSCRGVGGVSICTSWCLQNCKVGFVLSPLISETRRWCLHHLVAHSPLKTDHRRFTIRLCCKCVLVFFFRYNLGSPHVMCVKDLNQLEERASLWRCKSSGPQLTVCPAEACAEGRFWLSRTWSLILELLDLQILSRPRSFAYDAHIDLFLNPGHTLLCKCFFFSLCTSSS